MKRSKEGYRGMRETRGKESALPYYNYIHIRVVKVARWEVIEAAMEVRSSVKKLILDKKMERSLDGKKKSRNTGRRRWGDEGKTLGRQEGDGEERKRSPGYYNYNKKFGSRGVMSIQCRS